MNDIVLPEGKHVFFASDFHLGMPDEESSRQRERHILQWLERCVAPSAAHLFLLGDIFDFWFEYRAVVPKGFVRLLGMLAALSDAGVRLWFLPGNHDMWVDNYFQKELGMYVYRKPISMKINDKYFYLAHGDGLGPGDHTYKRLQRLFESRWGRRLFRQLHPDIGVRLGSFFSARSRSKHLHKDQIFRGKEEWLWQYACQLHTHHPHDYYVFGHRHMPLDLPVGDNARYVNTGEWLSSFSYAVFDGMELLLTYYEPMAIQQT